MEEKLKDKIITMQQLFAKYPNITIEKNQVQKLLNGLSIDVKLEDGIYNIYNETYIGLGIVKNKKLKRDIILE